MSKKTLLKKVCHSYNEDILDAQVGNASISPHYTTEESGDSSEVEAIGAEEQPIIEEAFDIPRAEVKPGTRRQRVSLERLEFKLRVLQFMWKSNPDIRYNLTKEFIRLLKEIY